MIWRKTLTAVLLLALLLEGALAAPAYRNPENRNLPAAFSAEDTREQTDVNAAGLSAKSKKKKKKNTAAPTATAAPTPEAGKGNASSEETEPGLKEKNVTPTPVPDGPIVDPRSIADWLFAHNMRLPGNFITKKQAQALGWESGKNLSDVAPGKSLGGDYFGNYQGKLPTGKGISYREADCYYTKGRRNAYRIIYSSDGRVWYTEDHYNTFEELFPADP